MLGDRLHILMFFLDLFNDSIIHEHSCKILYLNKTMVTKTPKSYELADKFP